MRKKKESMVHFQLDMKRPKPLTPAQRKELKALAAMPDSQIDYSDLPPMDKELFKKVSRGELYRPQKMQLTLRIDKDVIAWQRSKGKGYQSRINKILRQAMSEDLSASV